MTKNKPEVNKTVVAEVTESIKIWREIKDKEIHMFALPDQKVSDYCRPITIEPDKCYLVSTASSVLPSLEQAVGSNYTVESLDKYLVVSRKSNSPFFKK